MNIYYLLPAFVGFVAITTVISYIVKFTARSHVSTPSAHIIKGGPYRDVVLNCEMEQPQEAEDTMSTNILALPFLAVFSIVMGIVLFTELLFLFLLQFDRKNYWFYEETKDNFIPWFKNHKTEFVQGILSLIMIFGLAQLLAHLGLPSPP